MSGALQAAVSISASTPPSPLNCGVGVSGGSVPTHVTSASGDSRSVPDGAGYRYFSASGSGGTPPYTYKWTRQNGVNKTTLVNATSQSGAYVSWSAMIVGEYQSTTANCKVTDSTGATATSSTIVIGIQRDS